MEDALRVMPVSTEEPIWPNAACAIQKHYPYSPAGALAAFTRKNTLMVHDGTCVPRYTEDTQN